jgi:hypothetical protein
MNRHVLNVRSLSDRFNRFVAHAQTTYNYYIRASWSSEYRGRNHNAAQLYEFIDYTCRITQIRSLPNMDLFLS